MRDHIDIFSEGHRLMLSSAAVNDTTIVLGSRMIPAVSSNAHGYFSGYVFRGDRRKPFHIFRTGFEVQEPLLYEDQIPTISGTSTGITHRMGVSTTVCAMVASTYGTQGNIWPGNVYLIDARHFAGFSIPTPRPQHVFVDRYPILRQIYEVNFMHSIPRENIIGLVWPSNYIYELPPLFEPWNYTSSLYLAVNPEYEGGIEGAQYVVDRFNEVGGGESKSSCTIL